MASFFGQFKAVLKKNFILKMRNKKQALQEILMPIYFIAILAVIKITTKSDELPRLGDMPENSIYSSDFFSKDTIQGRVLVAPNNIYIKEVMNDAATILQDVLNLTSAPMMQYFSNRSEAEASFSSNYSGVLAGVVFQFDNNVTTDYEGGGNLSYAIRVKQDQIPGTGFDRIFSSQGDCRGRYESADRKGLFHAQCDVNKYLYTGFSALQAAIDTALIRKFGGDQSFLHPNISVKMLPKGTFQPDSTYIQIISAVYFVIAYSPLISFLTVNLVAEKEKKIKEGMRMMGLKSSVFWLSWGLVYAILILVVTAVVTVIAAASNFFTHSNVFIFFLLLIFYGLSIIGASFTMTPFFNKARVAGTIASFGSIIVSLLYLIVSLTRKTSIDGASVSYSISVPVRWILCLLSPVALSLGIDQAIYLDLRGGMNFDTAGDGEFPLYAPLGMLILDSILYFALAVYFDNVIPGEYGPRQKPWFLCTKAFWKSADKNKRMNMDMNGHYVINKGYGSFISSTEEEPDDVEPVPASMSSKLAVSISKLSKVFESKDKTVKAVNELSLSIYEGQITAILGHNGAGKTTLLNILTGLTGPTSGHASILGLDVSDTNDMDIIRQKTGICPQHNILFDDLTCVEHLHLFAGIKGVPDNEVEKEVKDALDSVGLADQSRVQSSKLSGGQKRKLSVAIAIIGDPKIIFLDEPTAGMDPYSRRHLWAVLKEKKKGRVILLTTHFMDEADILADRKAVVSKGSLRCCGSSLFLKSRFGLGYHLNMVVEPDTDHDAINNLVSGHIPGAEVNRIHGKELDITLPQSGISNFAGLFSALEQKTGGSVSKAESMGIKSYGVSMTTLEEVFLKLEEEEEGTELESIASIEDKDRSVKVNGEATPKQINVDIINNDPMLNAECVTGKQLFWQRLRALCKIRFLRHLRSPAGTIFQVFLPVVLVIVGLVLSKTLGKAAENTSAPAPIFITSAYYANMSNLTQSGTFGAIPNLLVRDTANTSASQAYITGLSSVYGIDQYDESYFTDEFKLLDVNPHYIGFNLKEITSVQPDFSSTYTALYNDSAVHSVPATINMMSNGLLKAIEAFTGRSNDMIGVYNYPWPQVIREKGWDNAAFTSTLILAMAFVLIPGGFGIDVVRDRQEKIRSQLRISGLPFSLYWLSFFLVEFLKFLIPGILVIIIVFIVQVDSLMPGGAMMSFVLTIITYMPANVLFAYFVSFMFDKWETAQSAMPIMFFMVGYIPYLPVSIVDLTDHSDAAAYIHYACCILDPAYVIFGSIYYTDKIYRTAQYMNRENDIAFEDYFKFDNHIVLCYVASAIHVVLFLFLLRVADIKSTGGDLREACCPVDGRGNQVIPDHNTDVIHQEDIDVAEERARVKAIQNKAGAEAPVALGENLRKEFTKNAKTCGCCPSKEDCQKGGNLEDKIKVAVRNVTFAVDAGEVFGLLGPNGAGKTTTLNMMTADVHPDKGKVIVGGHDVRSSMSKAFEAMGYCPQHDSLWETITLREHLECYALVRGIPKDKVDDVLAFFIENLKLEEHAKKHSKKLSGGTKRKLSYCISMLGKPSIVLLDEPSTGMDPQSKRFLWDTISSSFENTDRGAILTTHYMEEADALCSRIAIMVNGKMECIGSNQHLKNKYGSGYMLEVKLATKQEAASLDDRMDKLHQYILNAFPASSVMEQFSERVQYKVPKSSVTSLSRAFTVLEDGKTSHDIEEYSFSQSTLEQVFLEFAKRQLEEGQSEKEVEIGRQLSRALSVEGKHDKESSSYRL